MEKHLGALGFQQSRFHIAFHSRLDQAEETADVPQSDFDTIEFQFAPNPANPPGRSGPSRLPANWPE